MSGPDTGLRIGFLGAAGTVTGSRFLVDRGSTRVLVDCGLFQGLKVLRLRNWQPFPVDPASIDAVVLTHAHLDHSGWLPVLVRAGFRGPLYCTPPTRELAAILLADAGRLQEEDARYANRKGFSKHRPALPLYTEAEAAAVEPLMRPVGFGERVDVGGLSFEYSVAGHILGAASVNVRGAAAGAGNEKGAGAGAGAGNETGAGAGAGNETGAGAGAGAGNETGAGAGAGNETGAGAGRGLVFSGDLGRPDDLLIPAPAAPAAAHDIVMEGTYGDREHIERQPMQVLADVVRRTAARGGVLLVPAFAVGRAQLVLYMLHQLAESGEIPKLPVFLNSPMAVDVTALYDRYHAYHRLSREACAAAFRDVELVRSVDASKALNQRRGPFIAVAGAGMLTGGRILHHLRAFGADPRTTLLLAGYQAVGTRGAALLGGARKLKVHGGYIPIRAEVARLEGLSAHADRSELLDWLSVRKPGRVHLVHGEPEPLDALRLAIEERLGVEAHVPEHLETTPLPVRPRQAAER